MIDAKYLNNILVGGRQDVEAAVDLQVHVVEEPLWINEEVARQGASLPALNVLVASELILVAHTVIHPLAMTTQTFSISDGGKRRFLSDPTVMCDA